MAPGLTASLILTSLLRVIPLAFVFVLLLFGWATIGETNVAWQDVPPEQVYAITAIFWIGLGLVCWQLFAALTMRARMLAFAAAVIAITDVIALLWMIASGATPELVVVLAATSAVQFILLARALKENAARMTGPSPAPLR